MEKTIPLRTKTRDIVIGFLGWIIFHNLLFILAIARIDRLEALSVHFDTFWLLLPIMWLPAIVVPIVFFVKKRIWISTGIVAAVILNTGIWIFLFPLGALVGFPFPLGAFLFQQ